MQRLANSPAQPGSGATLSEVFPDSATDAAAVGFVLSRLKGAGRGPLLWVQDRLSQQEAGRPYVTGLGIETAIVRVDVTRPVDVLRAMEDGLRCKGLAAVVGEVWGDPPAVSFTATKRLAMRAEASGVACWLIRRAASPDLSAARDRWRVKSLPSAAHPYDPQAPGDPRWRVDLFRSRRTKTGVWEAVYDRAADRVRLSAPLRDGTVAARDGAPRQSRTG
ncbi:MAG: hypothetical protein AAFQ66_21580 [Pseudomonadota bacterium]